MIVATYTKCGTTLLQQLIEMLRSRGDMAFDEITEAQPWLDFCADVGQDPDAAQRGGLWPRVFKTHQPPRALARGCRVASVVRAPAAVLRSYHAFYTKKDHPLTRGKGVDAWAVEWAARWAVRRVRTFAVQRRLLPLDDGLVPDRLAQKKLVAVDVPCVGALLDDGGEHGGVVESRLAVFRGLDRGLVRRVQSAEHERHVPVVAFDLRHLLPDLGVVPVCSLQRRLEALGNGEAHLLVGRR